MSKTEMARGELAQLAAEAGQLALTGAVLLGEELAAGGDTKRAKDLAGIVKDMAALSQSLRGAEPMELTVTFADSAAEAAV